MTTTSATTSSTSSTASTASTSSTSSTSSSTSSTASLLTTLGAGSGIDTTALVTNLVSATYSPKNDALTTKENANTAQISELATLSNAIDTFSSSMQTLVTGGSLQTQPTSSDTSVLTATAQSGAAIGNLSASVTVKQLAKAQSLVSGYFASSTTVVGAGTLTLQTAKGSFPLTLDSSNDTLSGIVAAINKAGAGVTASIVTDASGARLAIKGDTGAANSFTMSVGDGSDAGLSALAYPAASGTTGMTQAQAAQDAIVTQDGVDVARSTNTISDLINGVTINLIKAAPDETISLGASRPTDAITTAVSNFVDAYNSLHTELASALASGGTFANNTSIRSMMTQLSRLTATALSTAAATPQTLAEIGVATARDGSLSVNSTTLSKMLSTYPDAVEAMFNPSQRSSDPLIKVTSTLGSTKAGTYQLTNIIADTGTGHPSGQIAGVTGLPNGTYLQASVTSSAYGLIIQPQGDVASATITVDPGLGGALKAIRDSLQSTNGLLTSLNTSLTTTKTNLATQRTKMESDESDYKDRLTSQFTTMDTKVAAAKATQSYLTQQIDLWTKSTSS